MKKTTILTLLIASLVSFSCVSARKFQDSESEKNRLLEKNATLSMELETATEVLQRLTNANASLQKDTLRLGQMRRETLAKMQLLSNTNMQLQEQVASLTTTHAHEIQTALARLIATQDNLQIQEDQLRLKEAHVNSLLIEINEKVAKVHELENFLQRQKEAVQQLRQTVAGALLGFEGRGLTVEVRQGKVYVSLEESLLFASGSATVERAGQSALLELAKVLEANPEITVMIEGHTDDVPLRAGGPIRDNWDLSVLRATSIIRILQRSGNISPQRFIAAGRGEFHPIDRAKTAEARRKNRRTEIILTPNLDPLFRIIEKS